MDTLRAHLRKAARQRWAKATEAEKKATASHAGRAYWANLTAEERSAEMKRRATKRKRKRTDGGAPKPKSKKQKTQGAVEETSKSPTQTLSDARAWARRMIAGD